MFGAVVFRAHETVTMPPPGDIAPARIEKTSATRSGIRSTRRSPAQSAARAEMLNHLQFLTIRRYLGFVFAALVVLLLTLALWQ